jgi:hypothetical protein
MQILMLRSISGNFALIRSNVADHGSVLFLETVEIQATMNGGVQLPGR